MEGGGGGGKKDGGGRGRRDGEEGGEMEKENREWDGGGMGNVEQKGEWRTKGGK